MSLFDIFNSNAQQTGASSEATGYPSIGDIQADYVNINNLLNNKATSADWGAATGAGIGFIFGGPEGAQQGANIGRQAFPMIQKDPQGSLGVAATGTLAGAPLGRAVFPILEKAGKQAWGFLNK